MSQLKWHVVVSEMFAENAYLIHLEGSDQCVIVDPSFDTDQLIQKIQSEKLEPVAILNTHGHVDHIVGNEAIKRCWPELPIVIGRLDEASLTDPTLNLSAQFGGNITSPPADELLDEGQTYSVAGIDWDIYHTPGHSPGHIILVCKKCNPWLVLGGDMVFQGGLGRTDFPGGSAQELTESIKRTFFTFPDDTIVLPGHGPDTTVGQERGIHPFMG